MESGAIPLQKTAAVTGDNGHNCHSETGKAGPRMTRKPEDSREAWFESLVWD